MEVSDIQNGRQCTQYIQPVRDVLDIISGKWKLPILIALSLNNRRFKDLQRTIDGISPRMLSKELRDLEANQLISRTVYDTVPVSVEYALTPYGRSLDNVIVAMREWGKKHRNKLFAKEKPAAV